MVFAVWQTVQADSDAAEALRLRVEEMTALVARRQELELRQAELAVPAEGVEALLAEVGARGGGRQGGQTAPPSARM